MVGKYVEVSAFNMVEVEVNTWPFQAAFRQFVGVLPAGRGAKLGERP